MRRDRMRGCDIETFFVRLVVVVLDRACRGRSGERRPV